MSSKSSKCRKEFFSLAIGPSASRMRHTWNLSQYPRFPEHGAPPTRGNSFLWKYWESTEEVVLAHVSGLSATYKVFHTFFTCVTWIHPVQDNGDKALNLVFFQTTWGYEAENILLIKSDTYGLICCDSKCKHVSQRGTMGVCLPRCWQHMWHFSFMLSPGQSHCCRRCFTHTDSAQTCRKLNKKNQKHFYDFMHAKERLGNVGRNTNEEMKFIFDNKKQNCTVDTRTQP